jgi:hypothetical protein
MALTVEISRADLLLDLMLAFRRSGCPATQRTSTSCAVSHPLATDAEEARLEIEFFVRAWQLAHPAVAATVAA